MARVNVSHKERKQIQNHSVMREYEKEEYTQLELPNPVLWQDMRSVIRSPLHAATPMASYLEEDWAMVRAPFQWKIDNYLACGGRTTLPGCGKRGHSNGIWCASSTE